MQTLIQQAQNCQLCAEHLPQKPKPIFQVNSRAKILIAGQAPGAAAHHSGIPFDDPSGNRLRKWMGISNTDFYDPTKVAILPMGFCYPGKAKSGDLPPRKECALQWRQSFLEAMPNLKLSLIIGKHALKWHMPKQASQSLVEIIQAQSYERENAQHKSLVMPHPSPRNNIWLKKNSWFEDAHIPLLQQQVNHIFSNS